MNLEQIDISTTAGKAEVMRLAAEGRKVAARDNVRPGLVWEVTDFPSWDWSGFDYAIITKPVGPDEVWLVVSEGMELLSKECAEEYQGIYGGTVVRYRRVEE